MAAELDERIDDIVNLHAAGPSGAPETPLALGKIPAPEGPAVNHSKIPAANAFQRSVG